MTFFSLYEDDDCDDNCSKCGELMLNDNQNIRYMLSYNIQNMYQKLNIKINILYK